MLPLALAAAALTTSADPTPPFLASTKADASRAVTVTELGTGWAARLRTGAGPVTVARGELVELRRPDRPLPPWPRGAGIVLANGDRVAGTVVGGDDRVLRFAPAFPTDGKATEWAVPLTALLAVWVTPPQADTPPDPAAYPWAAGPNRKDAVLLRNGDVLRGTVERFAGDPKPGISVKTSVKTTAPNPVVTSVDQFAAVAFDPSLARVRKPKGPFARLVVTGGSRISLTTATSDGVTLKGTTVFGATVELPLTEVVALTVFQGAATYLSDLKPKRVELVGYNGLTWPWTADRSAKGGPLRVGGQTFDKGLGTHPKTVLTYDLAGKYRRFEAVVGPDATGSHGTATARILVDGKEVFARNLTGPEIVTADVAKVKELTLAVDFGPGGDVRADVDWANARLVE